MLPPTFYLFPTRGKKTFKELSKGNLYKDISFSIFSLFSVTSFYFISLIIQGDQSNPVEFSKVVKNLN